MLLAGLPIISVSSTLSEGPCHKERQSLWPYTPWNSFILVKKGLLFLFLRGRLRQQPILICMVGALANISQYE